MINPGWLYRNVKESAWVSATVGDFWQNLMWLYSEKLPMRWKKEEYTICFRYPGPVGDICLRVRANRGSDRFIHGEVFHHRYYDFPLTHDPATILDLGANAGFTAVYFFRKYPSAHIAVVEPVAGNLKILRANLRLNSVAADVIPAAAGVEDGVVTLELSAMDYGHRVVNTDSPEGGGRVSVEALSMRTILRRLGWERIGLLKVDIEGYESELLKQPCDWLWNVDAMCIECHDGFGWEQLGSLANEYGFLPPSALPGIWLLQRAKLPT